MNNLMLWEDLKTSDFPEAVKKSGGVCVVPIGAMEKHGPHMPVGTDNFIIERSARLAAEIEPVVVFPTFGFGNINGLQHFDGSICFSNDLLLSYFDELCREIARSGFKKILIVNSHGGNPYFLGTLCNKIAEKKVDYVVGFINSYGTFEEDLAKALRTRRSDFPDVTDDDIALLDKYLATVTSRGHADYDEMMLVHEARPETLDVSAMGNESGETTHRTSHLRNAGIYTWSVWHGNHPNSFQGSHFPYLSKTLSSAYMKLRAEYMAGIYKVFKEDKELLKINEEWNSRW